MYAIRSYYVYRVTAPWTEGPTDPFGQEGSGDSSQPSDVTWIHTSYDTGLWSNPGGDFATTLFTVYPAYGQQWVALTHINQEIVLV